MSLVSFGGFFGGEQVPAKEKAMRDIASLYRVLMAENGKVSFLRDKDMMKQAAGEIKETIKANNLSYEECGIDITLISELTK